MDSVSVTIHYLYINGNEIETCDFVIDTSYEMAIIEVNFIS